MLGSVIRRFTAYMHMRADINTNMYTCTDIHPSLHGVHSGQQRSTAFPLTSSVLFQRQKCTDLRKTGILKKNNR